MQNSNEISDLQSPPKQPDQKSLQKQQSKGRRMFDFKDKEFLSFQTALNSIKSSLPERFSNPDRMVKVFMERAEDENSNPFRKENTFE